MIRHISWYLLSMCFLLTSITTVLGMELPKPQGAVNDFARILSSETIEWAERTIKELEQKTSHEVVVVTVTSLDGTSAEGYASALMDAWGVGKKKLNNGVVFLLAPRERKVRIHVGSGLLGTLNETFTRTIIQDEIVPRMKDGRSDEAVRVSLESIVRRTTNAQNEEATATALALLLSGTALGMFLFLYFSHRREQREQCARDLKNALSWLADMPKFVAHLDDKIKTLKSFPGLVRQGFTHRLQVLGDVKKFKDDLERRPLARETLTLVLRSVSKRRAEIAVLADEIYHCLNAQREAEALLELIPRDEKDLRHQFQFHRPNAHTNYKTHFEAVREQFSKIKAEMEHQSGNIDWRVTFEELKKVSAAYRTIRKALERDVRECEERTREAQRLAQKLKERVEKPRASAPPQYEEVRRRTETELTRIERGEATLFDCLAALQNLEREFQSVEPTPSPQPRTIAFSGWDGGSSGGGGTSRSWESSGSSGSTSTSDGGSWSSSDSSSSFGGGDSSGSGGSSGEW